MGLVASAKVPWHTVEVPWLSDVPQHIRVVEAMLAEMQLKVRGPRPTTSDPF